MTDYPTRTIDRTEGDAMFPKGRPTVEEQKRMEEHSEARRINRARDEGQKADFFDLREQDQYVTSSTVKGMMWEVADGAPSLLYEADTLYIFNESDQIVGRIQIEEREPTPGVSTKPGASLCLALSHPETPVRRSDEHFTTWERAERIAETTQVSVHGGQHGIQWARVWDQEEARTALRKATP